MPFCPNCRYEYNPDVSKCPDCNVLLVSSLDDEAYDDFNEDHNGEYTHEKSGATILLDILRNLLIIAATGYVILLIWQWHWIVALIAIIPVYIIMLNLLGFITLPLYTLTPENRLNKKAFNAFEKGEFEKGKSYTEEFIKKSNVNKSEESSED